MKGKIYVINDRLANENGPVFQAVNDAVALRQFTQVLEKTKYPEDYKLFCVGEIEEDGQLIISEKIYDVESMEMSIITEVKDEK